MTHDGLGAPAVVVLVGTDHHPFHRICRWVDDWLRTRADGTQCVMQVGTSNAPAHAEWFTSLPHSEVQRLIGTATAVVSHAGPATIMDCLQAGVRPIVVPRRHALGEHVDDHQVLFGRKFAERGMLWLAESHESLASLLDRAVADPMAVRVRATVGDQDTVARFGTQVSQLETRTRRVWRTAAR